MVGRHCTRYDIAVLRFDLQKTVQAAAVLIRQHAGRTSRLRLLKLLYIADREQLGSVGRSITGDHPHALKNGPVLTRTYDCIKGVDALAPTWLSHIANVGIDVVVASEPGQGRLSRAEVEKLQEVASRYAEVDDWALSDQTHAFAEWADTYPGGNTSLPIPTARLLAAVGVADLADKLAAEADAEADLDRLLLGNP